MAQSMKDLKIPNKYQMLFGSKTTTLSNLMGLQFDIQENVYGYDFHEIRKNMRDVEGFATMNYHAIQDELREFFEALGGMSSGGNAIWKPWKKKYNDYQNMSFDDLSEEDIKEIQFELVDLLHFVFNLMLLVGLTPEKLFNMYYAKNAENIKRQRTGY